MIIDKQPQVTQLQLKFKGTLVDDMQVSSTNELPTLNINFNYDHKLVWVKNEEAYYYLINGNGSLLSHWKKFSQKLVLEQYQNKPYILGDVVYLQNKIYIARENVLVNENPIDFGNKWEIIAGDIQTNRILFTNQSSIIIYTNIKNPYFDIWEGVPEFVDGIPILDSDGLIKVNNAEQISGYIKRRNDLPNNNGKPYEITFYANSVLSPITGIINIK